MSKWKGLDAHISWPAMTWITLTPMASTSFLVSMALTRSVLLLDGLSQTSSPSWSSSELDGLSMKCLSERDYEWRPVKVISSLNALIAGACSPKGKAGAPWSTLRLQNARTFSPSSLSVEPWLRALCKSLKVVMAIWQQHLFLIANLLPVSVPVPHTAPLLFHQCSLESAMLQKAIPARWLSHGFDWPMPMLPDKGGPK